MQTAGPGQWCASQDCLLDALRLFALVSPLLQRRAVLPLLRGLATPLGTSCPSEDFVRLPCSSPTISWINCISSTLEGPEVNCYQSTPILFQQRRTPLVCSDPAYARECTLCSALHAPPSELVLSFADAAGVVGGRRRATAPSLPQKCSQGWHLLWCGTCS